MPPPPPAVRGRRQGTKGPPPTPPPLPHRPESGRRGGPPTPPPHPPQLGSHRRGPPPPQGRGGAPPPPRRDGDAVRGTAAGPAPANPHRRAGATRTTEQEGGRAPHDPPVTTAHSGMTEGGFRSAGAPGGAVHGPPLTPPHPGAALQPRPHAHARRERAGDTERARMEYRRPPPGKRAGRPRRDTPHPPAPPLARQPRGPRPPGPRGRGAGPPPPGRGAGVRPTPPPQPPAPMGAEKKKRAHACAPGRRTDRTQRSRVSTNRSGMGGHAPHGQHNASDARFVACPGKAEGRNEAERPPALQAPPRPHNRGIRCTPPLPPQPAPQHMNGTDPPRGAQPPHGQSRAPTPARPRPQHVDRGPRQPAQWTGSRGRGSA